jgi:hypothetical protein
LHDAIIIVLTAAQDAGGSFICRRIDDLDGTKAAAIASAALRCPSPASLVRIRTFLLSDGLPEFKVTTSV